MSGAAPGALPKRNHAITQSQNNDDAVLRFREGCGAAPGSFPKRNHAITQSRSNDDVFCDSSNGRSGTRSSPNTQSRNHAITQSPNNDDDVIS